MVGYMQENEADDKSEDAELRRRLRQEHREVISKLEQGASVKRSEILDAALADERTRRARASSNPPSAHAAAHAQNEPAHAPVSRELEQQR